jgi:TRAP-type C4-dicarboxylate transport system permease small subunit
MMIAQRLVNVIVLAVVVLVVALTTIPGTSYATTTCGSGDTKTTTAIDIGCQGKGNAIADMLFAIIRILSYGVGLVVIASIVLAGIQYSASQGNPQETAKAVNRIRSSVFALLIYIFGFAILNYLIPGAFLH